MKPITLTPNDARNLHIPATEELLRGWVGPAMFAGRDVAVLGLGKPGWVAIGYYWPADNESGVHGVSIEGVSLPLSNPEVIDRMYRVFAAGVRCCPGVGRGCDCNRDVGAAEHDDGCRSAGVLCKKCCDTGYLRPPTDLSAFRGVKADGWGPELEAALLWASWVRMAGGMQAIGDVYGPRGGGCAKAGRRSLRLGDVSLSGDHVILHTLGALLNITPEGPTLRALVP